tara:strand:+ start:766 stop:2091 length:1326 start_codon:yes stop_codon:yes gene_type:complete
MNRYKYLLLLLLTPFFLKSQINTYSPYSYFGYGILNHTSNTNSISMGGLGIGVNEHNYLNFSNPATYCFLKNTSFELGVKSSFIKMSQNTLEQRNFTSGLSMIGLGFPISKKIGLAFSLSPYSSVGYDLTTSSLILDGSNDGVLASYNYHGSGGLNKLAFGMAWNARNTSISQLSIGLNFNYLFGSIERETTILSDQSSTYFIDKSDKIMRGLNPELGIMYSVSLEDFGGHIFNLGFRLQPKSIIHAKTKIMQATYDGPTFISSANETNILLEDSGVMNEDDFPSSYGIGFSLQDKNKEQWLIGIDYRAISAYSTTESEYNLSADIMRNYDQYIIGGFFTPNQSDIYNYFNRIKYRCGFAYSAGYLDIGSIVGESSDKLHDLSFSFGMALPMSKKFSIANIGLTYGVINSNSQSNYIQENYFNLSISMTLSEKWFNKRKIQ